MVRITLPEGHNDTEEAFKRSAYNPLPPPEKVEREALTAIVVVLVIIIGASMIGFAKFWGLL